MLFFFSITDTGMEENFWFYHDTKYIYSKEGLFQKGVFVLFSLVSLVYFWLFSTEEKENI